MANLSILAGANPFAQFKASFTQDGKVYNYFDLPSIDSKYGESPPKCQQRSPKLIVIVTDSLPFSIRVLLESAVRNCDNFHVLEKDVQSILGWTPSLKLGASDVEVSFKPARVILQVRNTEVFYLLHVIHFILFRTLLACPPSWISQPCGMRSASWAAIPRK